MVTTWALHGLLCHDFEAYLYTIVVLGPFEYRGPKGNVDIRILQKTLLLESPSLGPSFQKPYVVLEAFLHSEVQERV